MCPAINSQLFMQVSLDMFLLCRFDGQVLSIEEAQKVAGDRQAAIGNLRSVACTLQMIAELRELGFNRQIM